MWGVAWTTFAHHPVIGNGAGTYGRLWLMKRRDPITVEDAHSLYLETLSELGIVGLVLLTTVIVAPILAFRRLRSAPYVPAVVSVYIGLLVHAAIDWDWEMPVVTVAMLTCGATMVAAARRELTPLRRGVRIGAVAGASILVAGAAVLLVGNRDLDAAAAAAAGGSETLAVRAEAARQWVPWSPDPLRWLGSVQLERGNQGRARQLLGAALRRDRTDWSLWLELAVASKGAERHQAIIEAARLDPVGPDVLVTGGRYGLVTHARARSPGTG
jgi:hypothetical protein